MLYESTIENYIKMNKKNFIPSVNFHLWEPCNMRCKFCFATFQDVKRELLPKGHLPKEKALKLVREIVNAGFQKITFAGGEPTLCPWLPQLIKEAKQGGLTTMIVTNGSNLTNEFLEKNKDHLDWIAISIDSLQDASNLKIGRAIVGKKVLTKEYYLDLAKKIKHFGFGLKVNTVVNAYNYDENFYDFMEIIEPKRWKVLQVLPIKSQNDHKVEEFIISAKQFKKFVINHEELNFLIAEDNVEITNSYVMIDPAGRFFNNSHGDHEYSTPILEIGITNALSQMNYDYHKFIKRKGLYEW